MSTQHALGVTSKELYAKYASLTDDEFIYRDEDIDAIVIDIEEILESSKKEKFAYLHEVDAQAFNYDLIIIHEIQNNA